MANTKKLDEQIVHWYVTIFISQKQKLDGLGINQSELARELISKWLSKNAKDKGKTELS